MNLRIFIRTITGALSVNTAPGGLWGFSDPAMPGPGQRFCRGSFQGLLPLLQETKPNQTNLFYL